MNELKIKTPCQCEVCQYSRVVQSMVNELDERQKNFFLDMYDRLIHVEMDRGWAKHKHSELVMAVANKYPNESRHETALRYIKEREQRIYDEQQSSGQVEAND